MNYTFSLLAISVATFSLTFQPLANATEPEVEAESLESRDGMFIHLSSGVDSPQRVLMALSMAKLMAKENRNVLVYCDIDAVKLLIKTAPAVESGTYKNSKELLDQLIEMKVPVRACPSCMKKAGITRDDLITGIGVASGDEFFDFTEGRVLSVSY